MLVARNAKYVIDDLDGRLARHPSCFERLNRGRGIKRINPLSPLVDVGSRQGFGDALAVFFTDRRIQRVEGIRHQRIYQSAVMPIKLVICRLNQCCVKRAHRVPFIPRPVKRDTAAAKAEFCCR